jgi:hypothetical protein
VLGEVGTEGRGRLCSELMSVTIVIGRKMIVV